MPCYHCAGWWSWCNGVGMFSCHKSLTNNILCSSSDLLLMFTSWESIGEKYFLIHHFAALYAYYYVLVSCVSSRFGLVSLTSTRFPIPFCAFPFSVESRDIALLR